MLKRFRWRPLAACIPVWIVSEAMAIALAAARFSQGPLGIGAALLELVVLPAVLVFTIFYLAGEYDLKSQAGIGGLLLIALMAYYANIAVLAP